MAKKKAEEKEEIGVSIPTLRLRNVYEALREVGKTTVPMKLGMRVVDLQEAIETFLQKSSKLNNALIEKYGEPNEAGVASIGPDSDGWLQYAKAADELNELELDLGEPLVLYEKDGKYGWSESVKTPIALTPNSIKDLGDLLIRPQSVEEDDKVVGHIEPEVE